MRNKISFRKEPRFYINEKSGTVVCLLQGTFRFNNGIEVVRHRIDSKGIAKCSNNDSFDLQKGKRIALAKAENNIYNKAVKYCVSWQNHIVSAMSDCNDFLVKSERCRIHNNEFTQRLSDPKRSDYIHSMRPLQRGTCFIG